MDIETLRAKYEALAPMLTERTRRLWAAAEAESVGHGGIALVSRSTGLSRARIARGIGELHAAEILSPQCTRRSGGGRKRTIDKDVTLLADLDALLESTTAGLPDAALRWTAKSVRKLAAELQAMGHTVSHRLVAALLHELGYTLQANRKTREGALSIPIATPSSSTSTTRCVDLSSGAPRSFRWTPRKRNWWGISKTPVENGARKESPNGCGSTTSLSLHEGKESLTGCTT